MEVSPVLNVLFFLIGPFLHLGGLLSISSPSPCLPHCLNMFLGLHPQRGNTGVPGVGWALVYRGRGAHVGQVGAVSQNRGAEERGRQRRGHGGRGRWGVRSLQARRASHEAREGLQRGGGGDGGGEPGVQLQTRAQGGAGRAAEGEQRRGRGGVLQLDGAHLQLLLAAPLGPSVLEPHLKVEEGFWILIIQCFYSRVILQLQFKKK